MRTKAAAAAVAAALGVLATPAHAALELWSYDTEFLRAITLETVRSTGNLWPEEKDVVDWVRDHPEEARTIMRDLGARFERAGGGAP